MVNNAIYMSAVLGHMALCGLFIAASIHLRCAVTSIAGILALATGESGSIVASRVPDVTLSLLNGEGRVQLRAVCIGEVTILMLNATELLSRAAINAARRSIEAMWLRTAGRMLVVFHGGREDIDALYESVGDLVTGVRCFANPAGDLARSCAVSSGISACRVDRNREIVSVGNMTIAPSDEGELSPLTI